jgi:cysteinyl-tRNA synthetase
MALRLYNTLSRQVEPFVPVVPGRVSMYTCGPTVWNFAHIGNFRTFLFEDLLRRWLEAEDLEVFHVMNLTDVDDRIIREASARGQSIRDFTSPFAQAFFEDRDYLRIRPAHEYPRATEFVTPMIALVEGLLSNGTAYRGEDGSVYFAIQRFPAYGRLSQLARRELKTGASGRVSTDEYDKENAQDFALWKAARPEDEAVGAAWDAPFGRGRPGWHLECSAMALALLARHGLGEVLDIHAGGVDLIFPHHEDEIAQSCAFTGQEYFARYWLHGEFLNVRGTKMSKRFGNITTARDLKADGVDAGAIRLLMFQTHYRQKMDLTDESLGHAREGSRRLGEFDRRFRNTAVDQAGDAFDGWANSLETAFRAALDDDLNAPQGVAVIFNAVKEGNRLLDQGFHPGRGSHLGVWDRVMAVVDVLPDAAERAVVSAKVEGRGEVAVPVHAEGRGESRASTSVISETPPTDPALVEEWARQLARARLSARSRRDFKEADRIRDLLRAAGWQVRDNKDGTVEVSRV